jgi:hypothetical protein
MRIFDVDSLLDAPWPRMRLPRWAALMLALLPRR